MIAYATVGADDIPQAKRFYSAFLPALNYGLKEGSEGLSYALPVPSGQRPTLPDFYVKPTFNPQQQATVLWSPLKHPNKAKCATCTPQP